MTAGAAVTNLVRRGASKPAALYGAAVLRVGYGIAGVAYYLTNYADRHYLWGPDGVYPFDSFRQSLYRPAFSLYELSTSGWYFEATFHIGLVIAVAFALGTGGRLMTVAHYLFLWSLFARNPLLLDGGDNLAFLVLAYLIPVNATAHLALRPTPFAHDHNKPTAAILAHNIALGFIVTQLCIVYLASAMFKIQGQLWQDGTALYYVLQVPEYSWPVVTDHLIVHAPLVAAVTYGAVFFQLAFPALILSGRTRALAVALGVGFHAGIAVLMGLTSFSLYMVATEAVVLSDRHYTAVRRRLGRVGQHPSLARIGWRRPAPPALARPDEPTATSPRLEEFT